MRPMSHRFSDLLFTEAVRDAQEHYGTRAHNERRHAHAAANDALGPEESTFIEARDSFYMATVSESGWPYLQHRGGPAGFLRVLGARLLAFADFRGNLQYVSVGNLAHDQRAALLLMDYPQKRRLKILGHARSVDVRELEPEALQRVALPGYPARIERVMRIELEAFEWNCPQHITPRFTADEWLAASGRSPRPSPPAAAPRSGSRT